MDRNYTFPEIYDKIKNALISPGGEAARSVAVGVTEIMDPANGALAGMANEIVSMHNNLKLNLLINGLSSGSNSEKKLNELYNYVDFGDEQMMTVANLFRKTINAECPKVCFIYGLILADHTGNNTAFTQDELIVCKALENATEFDLLNFREIMEKHTKTGRNGKEKSVSLPDKISDYSEMVTTSDWCVYNRIFVTRFGQYDDETGNLTLAPAYYAASPADVLMYYLEKANQVWNYRSNESNCKL